MSDKEKRLLMILLALSVITLVIKAMPFLFDYYDEKNNSIKQLVKKTAHLEQLMQNEESWKNQFLIIKKEKNSKVKALFSAKSKELIAAKIQTHLKKTAKKSGVQIESSRIPEFLINDFWLLTSQNISIKGESKKIYDFLKQIENDDKRLMIKTVKLRANRNSLRGTLTIAAFSYNPAIETESL